MPAPAANRPSMSTANPAPARTPGRSRSRAQRSDPPTIIRQTDSSPGGGAARAKPKSAIERGMSEPCGNGCQVEAVRRPREEVVQSRMAGRRTSGGTPAGRRARSSGSKQTGRAVGCWCAPPPQCGRPAPLRAERLRPAARPGAAKACSPWTSITMKKASRPSPSQSTGFLC
jgi:hypothetical protein